MPNYAKHHKNLLQELFSNNKKKKNNDNINKKTTETRNSNNNPNEKEEEENIQKWRDLSPSRPPLSFLQSPEISQSYKNINFSDNSEQITTENVPSTSIYIPHNSLSSSRQLHIIYEESEPDSLTNFIPSNETDQPSTFSSSSPPLNPHNNTHSNSIIVISEPSSSSQGANNNNNNSIINEVQGGGGGGGGGVEEKRQLLKSNIKIEFCEMVQAAYDYNVIYKDQHPKGFQLLFDNRNQNISGVQVILKNGKKIKYLGFEGHPQYISPELFVNDNTCYDHEKADVWALGITLYQLLVGRSPFAEFNNHRQLLQQMMMIPELTLPNDLSKDVKDLLQKMLAPSNSRASLEVVMSHPWLKSYHFTRIDKITMKKMKKKKKKKNKLCRVFQHILRFIFYGPYPPPPSKKYI